MGGTMSEVLQAPPRNPLADAFPVVGNGRAVAPEESRRSYAILTMPRAGNVALTRMLRGTRILGDPNQWFNETSAARLAATHELASLHDYIRWVRTSSASSNGFFGVQLSWSQLENLTRLVPLEHVLGHQAPWFLLRRRNLVAQAIAVVGGDQGDGHEPQTKARFRAAEIATAAKEILGLERRAVERFESLGLTPVELYYEDIFDEAVTLGLFRNVLRPEGDPELRKSSMAEHRPQPRDEEWEDRFRSERADLVAELAETRPRLLVPRVATIPRRPPLPLTRSGSRPSGPASVRGPKDFGRIDELLPPGTRDFVVVYQFGKVASTSLVSSLSALDGVVAVQSHFLGRSSFGEMVDLLVDPRRSDFFFEHTLGQFVTNFSVERAIGAIQAGKYPGVRLTVLSLAREPIDWFRSSIAQDIDAHLAALRQIVGKDADADDGSVISTGFANVCERIATVLEAGGGIDSFRAVGHGRERNEILRKSLDSDSPQMIGQFLFRFLRPYGWFADHYSRYLGVDVSELSTIAPQVYGGDIGPLARTYVIRYEDLDESVPMVLRDMGIAERFELARENVTATTGLAAAVKEGLAASPVDHLRSLSDATEYARQFGYTRGTHVTGSR